MISMDSEGGVYNLLGRQEVRNLSRKRGIRLIGRHRESSNGFGSFGTTAIPMWSSSSKQHGQRRRCVEALQIADYYPANKPR